MLSKKLPDSRELNIQQIRDDLITTNPIGDGFIDYRVGDDRNFYADYYGDDEDGQKITQTVRIGITIEEVEIEAGAGG